MLTINNVMLSILMLIYVVFSKFSNCFWYDKTWTITELHFRKIIEFWNHPNIVTEMHLQTNFQQNGDDSLTKILRCVYYKCIPRCIFEIQKYIWVFTRQQPMEYTRAVVKKNEKQRKYKAMPRYFVSNICKYYHFTTRFYLTLPFMGMDVTCPNWYCYYSFLQETKFCNAPTKYSRTLVALVTFFATKNSSSCCHWSHKHRWSCRHARSFGISRRRCSCSRRCEVGTIQH